MITDMCTKSRVNIKCIHRCAYPNNRPILYIFIYYRGGGGSLQYTNVGVVMMSVSNSMVSNGKDTPLRFMIMVIYVARKGVC